MLPKFVAIVALYVFAGLSLTSPAAAFGGTVVVVVVAWAVVVDGVDDPFFLSLPVTLSRTITPTKRAATIAIVVVDRMRLRRFSAASRCSRAARAFSFLRARLSALGTGAECIRRILPGRVGAAGSLDGRAGGA